MREFTKEDAQRLINKMRINYGKKFIDQWAGIHEDELKQAMVEAYQGLSMEDFARGYARMCKNCGHQPSPNSVLGANQRPTIG